MISTLPHAYRAVLERLIDYAGLFPPAELAMPEAVANYAAYQAGSDRWALGRFVVPAARLDEFEAARAVTAVRNGGEARWSLSVLVGSDLAVEALRVGDFQRKLPPGVEVASVEGRAGEVVAVQALRDAFPSVAELYIECPPGHGLAGLLDAVARVGARAKLRTGGIRAGDFAEPETVARFVTACARARLPFKATAGLHHPVRGRYPLTYESGSACATMFGYLNLVLAATLAWEGAPEATVVDALRLDDGAALVAGDDDIKWGELGCTTTTLARARAEFVIAIGSCSFTEPLGEIRQR